MVFGFGKKKSSDRSISPPQQERIVSFKDIPSLLSGLESPLVTRIIQDAKVIKNEVQHNCKDIWKIASELEDDDLKLKDADKNLRIVVKRGKDTVVSTVKKETSSKLPNIEKYEDVIALNSETSQILKRIGDVLGLQTRVMHVFARKYADKLKDSISKLAKDRNSLQKLIDEEERFKKDSVEITEMIKKIDEARIQISHGETRVKELRAEKEQLHTEIANLEKDLHRLKSKDEYQDFLRNKKKIETLKKEKQEIKAQIDSQFLKISRPLSKYSYISAFEKPMKKIIEELMSDPYLVITPENKKSIIEILNAVTKSVLTGNVSVKDSEKSIQQIEETIEMLDDFLSLKEKHAKNIVELESSLNVFDVGLLEARENDLNKARTNLTDIESSTERIEKENKENHSKTEKFKKDLEIKLERLQNSKMTIKF